MATYFSDTKDVGSFTILLDEGRASLSCKIIERWEDTDNTTTARCGDPGVIEVKKVVGISERDEMTLKSSIEGSIGVKGLAELKSGIKTSLKREFSFHTEETTSKVINFNSPKCGFKTMFVYQLVREFEFSYFGKKWGSTKTWERRIKERTNIHDFMPDIEEFDDNCNCKKPPNSPKFDGTVVVDMGNVSIRAPYRKTQDGIEVRIDNSLLKIGINNTENFLVKIPTTSLPEIVVFLGEIEVENIEAAFYEYQHPMAEIEATQIMIERVRAATDFSSIEVLSQNIQNYEGEI